MYLCFVHRCWLAPIPFYAAFLAPVAVILILNIIAFVLVSRQLIGVTSPKIKKSSEASAISARLRRIISVMVLLGLTWVIAVFAVQGTGGVVIQYIFTVLNSLQGLFIFIFYCLFNVEAQKAWKHALPCCGEEDKSTFLSSKGEWTGQDNFSFLYTSVVRPESVSDQTKLTSIPSKIQWPVLTQSVVRPR